MNIDNDISMPLVNTSDRKIVIRRDWRWHDGLREKYLSAKRTHRYLDQKWRRFLYKHPSMKYLAEIVKYALTGIMWAAILLALYAIFLQTPPV